MIRAAGVPKTPHCARVAPQGGLVVPGSAGQATAFRTSVPAVAAHLAARPQTTSGNESPQVGGVTPVRHQPAENRKAQR